MIDRIREALVYGLGWEWGALLSIPAVIAAVILLVRFVGLKRALQIGAGLGAILGFLTLQRRARQQGWQDREAKLTRDTDEAVADYRKKQDEVADLSGAELDRRAQRWVRDDEAR
ncbi:hypothetical protein KHC23_22975 [Ancylobacter dichloromethanicus]|uniref:Uncharacterized protein n=1 Tax=Ancylobacter dichloromethanicus TaxID=518825 RepID=A0A9W6JCG7_9HYPH|nr:hypothetical protein [Ancylobacter dichloromethanicus]MBS7556498.1 hypothetical protein [Ancylobacter dichloromethanicus]GLK74717.1 hypothetical protein GCM10017643_48360 [Ancylobacter dichloromethanicus]